MARKIHCAICGSDDYSTTKRVNGKMVTRCCNQPCVRVNGALYRNREDAPEWQVISEFVAQKRSRNPMFNIPFGSTAYKRCIPAVKILLRHCGGDVELAKQVIRISFQDKRYSWRRYVDFFAIVNMRFLMDVIATAQTEMARAKADEDVESAYQSAPLFLDAPVPSPA